MKIFFVGAALTGVTALAQPCFINSPQVTVAVHPWSVVASDFNLDGNMDLAVGDFKGATLNVHPGLGNGTFGAPQTLTVSGGIWNLTVSDLNNDGVTELITSGYSTVNILHWKNGSFSLTHQIATGIIGPVNGVVVNDFTGDGRKDIVLSHSGGITVLQALQTGSFTELPPVSMYGEVITGADFNKDGKIDIAQTRFSKDSVYVLNGNGSGGFTESLKLAVKDPMCTVSGDFNNDGYADIAISSLTKTVGIVIYISDKSGGFIHSGNYPTPNQLNEVAIGDFNRDGNVDLVATMSTFNNPEGKVCVMIGKGQGDFFDPVTFITHPWSISAAVADFNNDSWPDFAITHSDIFAISLMLNCLGTDIEKFGFREPPLVWPNPVIDELLVRTGEHDEFEIQLMDLHGRTVFIGKTSDNRTTQLPLLQPGLYTLITKTTRLHTFHKVMIASGNH